MDQAFFLCPWPDTGQGARMCCLVLKSKKRGLSVPNAYRLGWVLLFLFLFLVGCARLQVPVSPQPDPGQILTRAADLWQQGDTQQAEELYAQAVHSEDLSRRQRLQAWQGLARAAQANGHWETAELALLQWAEMEPEVRSDWRWQSRYLNVLSVRDREAWFQQARELLQDPAKPWALKIKACKHVVRNLIQARQTGQAWSWLQTVYQQAPGQKQRKELELAILDLFRSLNPRSWETVVQSPPQDDSFAFFLARWVQAERDLDQGRSPWSEVWSRLRRILEKSNLASADLLKTQLTGWKDEYGPPVRAVALLSPLSGDYADIGWKIALGASVAQWQLELAGTDLDIYILNSGDADWMSRLESLPPECRLIGGPVSRDNWKDILDNTDLPGRTFFPFRSTLDPGREGRDGFRFFPGTQDQIRPLLELMQNTFGIHEYAVLHPNSAYGYRLLAGFEQALEKGYGQIGVSTKYDPRSPGTWKEVVARLLNVPGGAFGDDNASVPAPDFQAVFLPDTFAQVQMLIPEFFYFDQDHLFFLGPILWSQGLQDIAELDRKYFRLALMTTPWLPERSTSAAQQLRRGLEDMNEPPPDFWVALGYDFVRFAHRLEQSGAGNHNSNVSAALSSFQDFSWSMAPISWDDRGRARQELFVVQPAGNGVRAVIVDELKTRWEASRVN
jgi:hypothetical protein